MAWEWSHTAEAYDTIRARLERMPREALNVLFAEWRASQERPGETIGHNFNERRYARALAWISRPDALPDDVLVDWIWERMADYRTCTNGGFEAYACPYGCGPHLLPFDQPSDNKEEEI
jgi:hypothetical protein